MKATFIGSGDVQNEMVGGSRAAKGRNTDLSLTEVSGRTLSVMSNGGKVIVDCATVVGADTSDRRVWVRVIDRVLSGATGWRP